MKAQASEKFAKVNSRCSLPSRSSQALIGPIVNLPAEWRRRDRPGPAYTCGEPGRGVSRDDAVVNTVTRWWPGGSAQWGGRDLQRQLNSPKEGLPGARPARLAPRSLGPPAPAGAHPGARAEPATPARTLSR